MRTKSIKKLRNLIFLLKDKIKKNESSQKREEKKNRDKV
jgi:hypothetical protein